MLIRSWNVFHGRTAPPGPQLHLHEMVELASRDAPDVLCLQEVPLWALSELEKWSGMKSMSAVAKRSPVPRWLGRILQQRYPRQFRSGGTGQANAILLGAGLRVLEHKTTRISERGRERRVCHVVRLDGFVIGNVHATGDFRHPDVPRAELKRAHALVESMAPAGAARVLAGDFNLRDPELPGPNIDHIVVAGIEHGPLEVWPDARRLHNGAVLSDHAPVEMRIG